MVVRKLVPFDEGSQLNCLIDMSHLGKIVSISVLFALTACYDEEQFPDTPQIEFRSLEFVDSPNSSDTLILKFYFEDGDANLGVTTNDFSSPYTLYVDSEPKILTEANVDDAVAPVFLAPLVLDNVRPVRLEGNTVTIIPGAPSYPAFLEGGVYTDRPDTIEFECPRCPEVWDLIAASIPLILLVLDRAADRSSDACGPSPPLRI